MCMHCARYSGERVEDIVTQEAVCVNVCVDVCVCVCVCLCVFVKGEGEIRSL